MNIEILAHSVVIAIGGKNADMGGVLHKVPSVSSPWQVNEPEASSMQLRTVLSEHGRARVAMPRAHAKAIKDVASIAKKAGAKVTLLQLSGSPVINDLDSIIENVHVLEQGNYPDFTVMPMPYDHSQDTGPFDIIGDIHGTGAELVELLTKLGHMNQEGDLVRHPGGRKLVFLGDYTDRGDENRLVLDIVKKATHMGHYAIMGNHDYKLMRWLKGANVRVAAGLSKTVEELEPMSAEWKAEMAAWLESLHTHLILDNGSLIVAHAGLSEELHGKPSKDAESFALYGKTLDGGKTLDEDGYPATEDWAFQYQGKATVVHGHVVHKNPREVNNVVAIDTGAVFGGHLTAYRWPEKEFLKVKAHKVHFESRSKSFVSEDAGV